MGTAVGGAAGAAAAAVGAAAATVGAAAVEMICPQRPACLMWQLVSSCYGDCTGAEHGGHCRWQGAHKSHGSRKASVTRIGNCIFFCDLTALDGGYKCSVSPADKSWPCTLPSLPWMVV